MNEVLEKENVYHHTEFAGFWIRFAAYLIDSIILGLPLGLIAFIILTFSVGTSDAFLMLWNDPNMEFTAEQELDLLLRYFGTILGISILSMIIYVAYFAGLHASKWQGTIGKKLLGLQVSDIHGRRISFWRALGRYFAMAFLSGILMIGYIMAAFTENKQALHDLIAGTVVTKKI